MFITVTNRKGGNARRYGGSAPTEGSSHIVGYDSVKQSEEAKSLMGIVTNISNSYTGLSA